MGRFYCRDPQFGNHGRANSIGVAGYAARVQRPHPRVPFAAFNSSIRLKYFGYGAEHVGHPV